MSRFLEFVDFIRNCTNWCLWQEALASAIMRQHDKTNDIKLLWQNLRPRQLENFSGYCNQPICLGFVL